MKKDNTLIGAGVLSSFTASICCITPVFALVAGTSGIASTFSWLESARPYFIAFTILTLGFAWYQILKPKREADCHCETPAKPKLIETKTFLGILTAFAMLMLAFPSYSHIFYPKTGSQTELVDNENLQTVEFSINGMTCTSCEEHVNHEVNKLSGIISSTTSYDNGNAVIQFDSLKTNVSEIETAINSTGYKVTERKEK
ncbi:MULTISPECIES: mercuric transport protein MerTP [Algoriphagus]|jgi:mercuric ion transport protein|uniref:Mercuric transport protein MerT n=3 Tax=Algoriphagus TaxID=246875 RepID=A0A1I7A7V6_9BACT|nr:MULTISPECIES: mercuric transport protein MerTP [Algoriphagus]MBB6326978.1 copper chaperone CopZ [Algoriphagus iocasae]SFT71009.1 Copper chaperone CopZ [Algoriphagus locisalis]SMP17144.1 Copper chaperone CopZ [Algoriphagus winogradskyi]